MYQLSAGDSGESIGASATCQSVHGFGANEECFETAAASGTLNLACEYNVLACGQPSSVDLCDGDASTQTGDERRRTSAPKPVTVQVKLDGRSLAMELDTGAAVSLISRKAYDELWPSGGPKLNPTDMILSGYSGNKLEALGVVDMLVEVKEASEGAAYKQQLFVVYG